MAQARTLRKNELKQLIDVTASCSRYPQRDVTMLMFSHLCGLRVGEIAGLRFDDVLDDKSNMHDEITLDASRTKGKRARKIFLPNQMQKHLQEYVASIRERPLFKLILIFSDSYPCLLKVTRQSFDALPSPARIMAEVVSSRRNSSCAAPTLNE